MNNGRAVGSLFFTRVIYAVNWFNFAAIFALIARDFNQNVSGLGAAVGTFYLGACLFQIPGGLLAAKIGPKRTATYGTLLASVAALLTSVSTDFSQLPLLRFIGGAGMAFVFAPAVILMARYFRERAEGFSVGVLNSAFYLGGALGIFGWAVLAELWGWRESLALSGGLGVFAAAVILWLVPRDPIREDFAMDLAEVRRVFTSRRLLLLGLGMFGMNGMSSLVTAFMVFYLEGSVRASAALAGGVGALALLGSLLSAPLFGLVYDRSRNASGLMFLCGLAGIAGLEIASLGNILAAAFASVITGLAIGGALTIGFSASREVASGEYQTLGVSCINSTQLFSGFFFPPIFSATVLRFGYSTAWMLSGLYTAPFILLVLLARSKSSSTGQASFGGS
jgi:MFS family permease